MSKLIDTIRKSLAAYRDVETVVRIYILRGGLILGGGLTWKIVPWTRISEWMIEPLTERPMPINRLSLLLLFGVPVLTFFLGYNVQKYYWKEKRFFFTTTGPFKWKTDTNTRETSNKPYCRKHELGMLKNKDGFWCPAHPCRVGKNVSFATKGLLFLIAIEKAEARLDRHLKENIFIKLKSWWRFRKKTKELNIS